ncbi:MAG: hypothetical protein WCG03_10670, partial [Kiritimatiellales bacterium]
MSDKAYRTLMEVLFARFPVQEDALMAARAEAEKSGTPFEEVLVNQGAVPAPVMLLAKAEYLEMPPISLDSFRIDTSLVEMLPKATWVQLKMLPLCKTGRLLTVAVADPFNIMGIENLKTQIDCQIFPVIADPKDVITVLEGSSKESSRALEDILKDIEDDNELEVGHDALVAESLEETLEGAADAPVVRIVNSILIEALRKHASDIHIEPMEKKIRLRYRVDGML